MGISKCDFMGDVYTDLKKFEPFTQDFLEGCTFIITYARLLRQCEV